MEEVTDAWFDGFTKLTNALYLKDIKCEGYLPLEVIRAVVESYR